MPERTYRNVEVDLDDLADAVVEWFETDGFEVQDFQEGPTIFIQSKKENLFTKVSFTGQALNVRVSPLARGFKIEVGAGEWLDKGLGVGATAAAIALPFVATILAVPLAAATGYGIYQQMKLPEQLMDFVEAYVDRHGVRLGEHELEDRRGGRRSRGRTDTIDEELDELRREPELREPARGSAGTRTAPARGKPAAQHFCPRCGAEVYEGSAFCHECGYDLRGRRPGGAARPEEEPTQGRAVEPEAPRPAPDQGDDEPLS